MGRRGPPPQPTRLRVINGNRGRRPLNKKEPQLQPVSDIGDAKPPKFLDAIAVAEWNRVFPDLIAADVLAKVDLSCLANYCRTWSLFVSADRKVAKMGMVIIGTRGTLVKNPMISVMQNAQRDLTRLSQELGITPASRSRVTALDRREPDDLAAAFFK